jgi:carboxymethylenebutenolidase
MAITTRYEQVTTEGGTFDAYCAVPESGRGPGILLFQEIFGINDNMRGLADRVAEQGYVALVPDMFWRLERRFERKDESGMGDGIALVMQLDMALAMTDIQAAHAHLLAMPECTGKVGAVGFCLGGGLAFACAATSRVEGQGPDAAVAYYGSHVNALLHLAGQIECPVMYHYGDEDAFIPKDKIDEVEQAVQGSPGVEFHRYAAGHAFSNWDAPSMYDQPAAEQAWARTLAFFERHLT